jgi:hypothetical protein
MAMPNREKPTKHRRSAFPDREVIAKAEGRFARADKQRASIKADPKRATQREKERVEHVKRAKQDK